MDIAACGTLYSTGGIIVDYGTLTAPDYLADLVHFFSQGYYGEKVHLSI